MFGSHFLTLADVTAQQVAQILETAQELKAKTKRGEAQPLLNGKTLIMIFEKPSNRTRVSFEVGMLQLGGNAVILRPDEIQMGKRESIADVAKVLSRYGDGVMMRVVRHTDIVEFARYATVPVINGLSDLFHPCQAVSDMLTIAEHKGRLEELTLCYIGDGNNVCNSLIYLAQRTGMRMVVSCPEGYEPTVRTTVAPYEIINDPEAAVVGADVLYTDVWTSMGQEDQVLKRLRAFEGYTVTEALLKRAAKDAIFMHCLPAHRGEEVDDSVMDSPQSVVFDQAENRLHAQKAILALLLHNAG
ncbi:MAG: ornithine carbamoyltransferase [Bdellovibrionales bacterium]|nr:ornithine carbamoyltransferase [Bdellovibrionales bacterium]